MMKRVVLAAALAAFVLSVPAWGATITVTSPAAGISWCKDNAYTITWTQSGGMQATVAIRLRVAGSSEADPAAATICNGDPNDGSYSWKIPNSIPDGQYFIRVRTDDSTVIGDSAPFKVVNCQAQPVPPPPPPPPPNNPPPSPPPDNLIVTRNNPAINPATILPTLRVIHPASGAVLSQGNEFRITWTLPGGLYNEVKIMSYPAGQPGLAQAGQVRWIAKNAPNTGSFKWKLEPTERTGKHVVRVQTLDDKVYGDSGEFTINPLQTSNTVHLRAMDVKDMLAVKATIDIERLDHGIYSNGDIQGVGMIVRAQSPAGFVLTPLFGHPKYGSLYARCVIEVPRTAKDGSFTAIKVHDAVYSLKGAPPFKLDAHPTQIGWAADSFNANFDPDCQGLATGQKVAIKQKSSALEGGKLCIAEYYPKLTVTLHLVTQNGEAIAEKSIYIRYDLDRGPKEVMVLPGEVDACTKKGMQNW
jgi:hypothetical protein